MTRNEHEPYTMACDIIVKIFQTGNYEESWAQLDENRNWIEISESFFGGDKSKDIGCITDWLRIGQ